MLKNISFLCQTTDGLLNSGQLEYHIFITAIIIPAHHRHLHPSPHVHTSNVSCAATPFPSQLATMLQRFAAAAATAQHSSDNASLAAAAQCCSGGRRRAGPQQRPPRSGAACRNFPHAAPVFGPTTWRLKKIHGQGWSRGWAWAGG